MDSTAHLRSLARSMTLSSVRYVVVTPVRDEEAFVENTIRSMVSQTVLPAEWVVVDDGSSDRTGAILDEHAARYEWMRVIHRVNRGFRSAGGGVIDAFYSGYGAVTTPDWEFIVKLDGDLSFEKDYFERALGRFLDNPKLGIGGGSICNLVNGELQREQHPKFHVRGATKIYRRKCWDGLGGLLRVAGWDTLDEVKANMLGWTSETFTDLELVQYRFTGAADGQWKSFVKYGRANYVTGYHPLFMILKCLRRLPQRPVLVGSIGLLYGFVSGYVKGVPKVDDHALIAYVRKQQLNRIFMKESIWE